MVGAVEVRLPNPNPVVVVAGAEDPPNENPVCPKPEKNELVMMEIF